LASDAVPQVCHIQLWTAGVGVSAGFHNHTDAIFCEIHACIVNGTGKGGMSWATVPDDQFDPNNPDPSKYRSIVVDEMHEHGPLWRTDSDGLPLFRTNATVDYPWHGKFAHLIARARFNLLSLCSVAWQAGFGEKQSFDVWLAFEFPPLASVTEHGNTVIPPPGNYRVFNSAAPEIAAAVKNEDSTDGTPIIGAFADPEQRGQQVFTSLPRRQNIEF
jgi:aldos-2-ulose dehydratase